MTSVHYVKQKTKNNKHVFLCEDPQALQLWETMAAKLDKDLHNLTAGPTI
jgi:hypothetical protein